MAEEEKEENKTPTPAPKKKGMLLIIIGVVVVALLVGGLAFFFLSKGKKSEKEDVDANSVIDKEALIAESQLDDEDQFSENEEALGAIFPMDTFVVNLNGGKFIRLQMQIEFANRDVPMRFMNRMPVIRDGIISSLNQYSAEKILAENGKDNLKKQIKEFINSTLAREEVKKIYFTQFIVQ